MKSTKREPGGEVESPLSSSLVLAVNPRVTFRWSTRTAEADNRSRNMSGVPDESVGLSTLRVEERTLLALADGRRSVEDLAKLAGMSTAVATRHLRSMCDRGLLVAPGAQTAEGSREWSGDMLAPKNITDALMNGPVEYDYSVSEGALDVAPGYEVHEVARREERQTGQESRREGRQESRQESGKDGKDGKDASSVPSLVPSPTVIVGADITEPTVAKGASASSGATTDLPASPPDSRSSQPAKKSPSGPNVTLFWSPSPSDQSSPQMAPGTSSSEGPALPSAPAAGEGSSAPTPRKTTGEGTVVVIGSPPASSSSRVNADSADGGGAASRSAAGVMGAAAGETAAADSSSGGAVPTVTAGVPSAAIPFRVGSYEVATRIAQGAMGSIYVCRRVGAAGFQRLFTLKVVRQYSTQKEIAVRSFMREARIGALLDHPNVQTLVDVGTYEDQPFLILDYIEGTNLADLLSDDRRAPAPIIVSVLLDILRGLQHVHDVADEQGARSGLVHGDVSPQNVLVGVDGAARLTDFGSARFAMERERADNDQVAVGKPAYMAPEQLRGELGDARTDLFSVGIVMWTALTGQKLFAAETYDQTAMRVMRRKIPPPSEHGAPACLDSIVLKALNRAPEGRYSTAEEMGRDLLKAAAAENLVASPSDVGQWVRRELGETLADRRRKIQEMFGGAAVGGSVGGSPGGSRTSAPQGRPQPVRPYHPTPKTADGYERLPAKTIQISAVSRDLPGPAPYREARVSNRNTRSQWYVVILSAVVAGCALIVAIAYLVSSLMSAPKRSPAKRATAPALSGAASRAASGAEGGAASQAAGGDPKVVGAPVKTTSPGPPSSGAFTSP